jgi:hypothetical protein
MGTSGIVLSDRSDSSPEREDGGRGEGGERQRERERGGERDGERRG